MNDGFDLVRILFGVDEAQNLVFYLEIVFRTVVMYGYTIVLARLVGQGSVGQIGPFEFILVIAVGSAAGDPMFYPEVGLLQGILVITVVILLHRFTVFVFNRHRRLEEMLEGGPLEVVRDGQIVEKMLGAGTLTERELLALLRCHGVRDTGEIEAAYFEPNGSLSVFRRPRERQILVKSTFPPSVQPKPARRKR